MFLSRQTEFSPDMSWQQTTPANQRKAGHAQLQENRVWLDECPQIPGRWIDLPAERLGSFDELRTIGQAVNSSVFAQMLRFMARGKRRCTDVAVELYRRSKSAYMMVREFRLGWAERRRQRSRRPSPTRSGPASPRRSPPHSPRLNPQIAPGPSFQEEADEEAQTIEPRQTLTDLPRTAARREAQQEIAQPATPDQEDDLVQRLARDLDFEPTPSLTGDDNSKSSLGPASSETDLGDDENSPEIFSSYDEEVSSRDNLYGRKEGKKVRIDYGMAFNQAYPMQARARSGAKTVPGTRRQSSSGSSQQFAMSRPSTSEDSWYSEEDARPYKVSDQTHTRRATYATVRREEHDRKVREGQRRIAMDKAKIKPLSAEWESRVRRALTNGHGDYTQSDFAKVIPQNSRGGTDQWLNDEAVNGYLKLATTYHNTKHPSTVPKAHAFTSFMFQNMMTRGGYKAVERWAKRAKIGGFDLLKVDTVFIPVNHGNHWTLMVVYPRGKVAHYYDSMGGNSRLQNQGAQFFRLVKEWLFGELGDKYTESEWEFAAQNSPQQDNCSDCGVFAITTAKMLILGSDPMVYGPPDIPTQRRRIVAELINGSFL